jgi:hypothetical protein
MAPVSGADCSASRCARHAASAPLLDVGTDPAVARCSRPSKALPEPFLHEPAKVDQDAAERE